MEDYKTLSHKAICEYLHNTYIKKNHDYGDSFHKAYEKYGITAAMIQIENKFNRLDTLINKKHETEVDESIRDTLLDLANYAILTMLELDKEDEKDLNRLAR